MGTKHLTEADRLRARTLFFDAGLSKSRICQITGFSLNQVKLAIREKTPKSRSGRPPRHRAGAGAASSLSSCSAAAGEMMAMTPDCGGFIGLALGHVPEAAVARVVDIHTGGAVPLRHKWESAFSPPPCYSWPPPSSTSSGSSTSQRYEPEERAVSPPAPPTASLRASSSAAPLGILSLSGFDRDHSYSGGTHSPPFSVSSSLASSAIPYSSLSSSPSGRSSSSMSGGVSLPPILAATALRP